jgi:hypothetical protein
MERKHAAMTLLYCKQCDEPIRFDDDHISERSGKKIPWIWTLTSHITVLYGGVSRSKGACLKGVIIAAVTVVVSLSILKRSNAWKTASGFH